jgi:glc operon protein GlcG
MKASRITLIALAALASSAAALAQAPAPAPAPAPDYGMPITSVQAKAAAAAAIAEMNKNSWRMAVAVVDPSGNLVHFEKVDGTQHASVEIALGKAKAAAGFKRPTKAFADGLANNPGMATLPGVIASEGGVPVIVGGRIIGAVGCSGGTGQQDGVACTAGAAAVR